MERDQRVGGRKRSIAVGLDSEPEQGGGSKTPGAVAVPVAPRNEGSSPDQGGESKSGPGEPASGKTT